MVSSNNTYSTEDSNLISKKKRIVEKGFINNKTKLLRQKNKEYNNGYKKLKESLNNEIEKGNYLNKINEKKNIKEKVEKYLIEITKSNQRDNLIEEINNFFNSNIYAIKYLYNNEYSLINRLHLITKIKFIKFKLEEIILEIKEIISNSEKVNIKYFNEEIEYKGYKNRDAINISYFLNVLNDSKKISYKDFKEIESFNKKGLKEKMWRDGIKLFSNYKFKEVKILQREKWLKERMVKESEITDFYLNGKCNISIPIFSLINIYYEEMINNNKEIIQCKYLIINYEEFLKELNDYEEFEDIILNTMHLILDNKKEETKNLIFSYFRNKKSILKLIDLCYLLNKLQQNFIIKINIHKDFNDLLSEFIRNEYSIKINIQKGEIFNNKEEYIEIPSNLISIDDFFNILNIKIRINNL